MREPKPFWGDVPQSLCKQIEDIVGAQVRAAVRVFGGYGPSATFRLYLDNGQTVFAKGAGNTSNEENWRVVPLEEFVYQHVNAIRGVAPRYVGSVKCDGWHLLLLEDLRDVQQVPPWELGLAKRAVHDIAEFHVQGTAEANKLDVMPAESLVNSWGGLRNNDRAGFLGLFQSRAKEAEDWLTRHLDALEVSASHLMDPNQPWGLIHTDIRSDNLSFRQDGSLVLFDWPLAARGPLIGDVAFFAPSVWGEGGPDPMVLITEYRSAMASHGIHIPDSAVQSAAAATAGYFASRAGRSPVEGLPRLRQVQQLQLRAALPWAAAVLGLPNPPALG